jgi:hypothetical protein
MALFFAPVANVVLSAVRREEEGQASRATNAIRELGGVFGVAVLASIFAHYGGFLSGQDFVTASGRRSGSERSSWGWGRSLRSQFPRVRRTRPGSRLSTWRPREKGGAGPRRGGPAPSAYEARQKFQASCMRCAWPAVNSV